MPDQTLPDRTLPAVSVAQPGRYAPQPLVCTIVFHPSIQRIGERFELPLRGSGEQLVLGRNGPLFAGVGSDEQRPIADRHISRRALLLSWRRQKLHLERPPETSRAKVAGRELSGSLELDRSQLLEGVPLMLAHNVVLLLRYDQTFAGEMVARDRLGFEGSSNYLANLRREIHRAALLQDDVLIRGETGSGKELVARAIHAFDQHATRPLVTVNMAAIPTDLAAAALFGNARGAFTGADRANEGYFQQADGGTLFLDEVGDTPPGVQPQLLRALQQREIQPLGGTVRGVSLRVISATDAQLEDEACDFKTALRHRLASLEIRLLPLRDHPEDIGELTRHFLLEAAQRAGTSAILPTADSSQLAIARWAELFHQLLRYDWPGNVRELSNTCRQVVAASEAGLVMPRQIRELLSTSSSDAATGNSGQRMRNMHDVGEEEFARAWEQGRFEPAGTARLLGVSRQSVYRRIDGSGCYRLAGQLGEAELEHVLAECDGDSTRAAACLRVSLSGLRAVLRNAKLEWY